MKKRKSEVKTKEKAIQSFPGPRWSGGYLFRRAEAQVLSWASLAGQALHH
jgi:hypothetical protein